MVADKIRIGPSQVFLETKDTATTVPALNTLVVDTDITATAVTPTQPTEIHDVNLPLDASTAKQIYVALMGYDSSFGGYGVARSTGATPAVALTITAGQGVAIHIDNTDFPANMNKAVAAAVFLKEGTADPVLVQLDIIDSAKDFDTIVIEAPHPAALSFTEALITAATASSDDLGDRTPKGKFSRLLGPTIDGVGISNNVDSLNVDLDTAPAYPVATARQPSIDFQVAQNDTLNFIRANAGIFAKFTPTGKTSVIDVGRLSIASAMAILRGNTSVRCIMPPDNEGLVEIYLFLGLLTTSQTTTNIRWGKKAVPTVNFQMSGAPQDVLLRNIHTQLTRRYKP